jgi:hypothetical protein
MPIEFDRLTSKSYWRGTRGISPTAQALGTGSMRFTLNLARYLADKSARLSANFCRLMTHFDLREIA